MKKRILALSLAVATVITVLAVGIFASTMLRSSNAELTAADTGPVIVAGYTTSNITVGKQLGFIGNVLRSEENWVLPGRLVDAQGNVTGTFGAQWDGTFLYLAVNRSSSSATIYLSVNKSTALNVSELASESSLTDAIAELKIPLSKFGIDTINASNNVFPFEISGTCGSFSGKIKLSSVEWWNTYNVQNNVSGNIFSHSTTMRGYDINDAVNAKSIGCELTEDGAGVHLWDNYSTTVTNYMGTMTTVSCTGSHYAGTTTLPDKRENTVYVSFDFRADAMPVYELAEALSAYNYNRKYSNFGFTWQIADAYDEYSASNVSMGGIVNTADGLYLVIAGRYYHTLKLDKGLEETFNVGLAWHSNGDLTVYIDGEEKGYFTDATRYIYSVLNQGVQLMCWRNELDRAPGDDFDLYISNLAFGSAQPDDPIKALPIEDIIGNNSSAEAVTSDLNLPSTLNTGLFQVTDIEWESSKPEVISNTGLVNQPTTGAEKVTLTAKLNDVVQKTFDVIVLGNTTSSSTVLVVEGDKTPSNLDKTKTPAPYTGVFHFDSNNNSIVYDQEESKPVNVITLTDLDEVSRLNRETISIWTSDDNVTYTRVEDNYKLFHDGKDWHLYNFEANARYIKVNYTLYESIDPDVTKEYVKYSSTESDFTNVLSNIMTVGYEDVFGAEDGTFSETTVTIRNNSGKKQQDHAWCISGDYAEIDDLSNVRVMLDGEYLYHYVDGDNLYVRIPDVEKGASVTLTILYGNDKALEISDKESVYEVTYGTKEMYMDSNQRYMFALEAGTALRNGDTLEKDVLMEIEGFQFNLSYDGGETWKQSGSFKHGVTEYTVENNGGYIFYNGRLYWRTKARATDSTEILGLVITYSDDGGETWPEHQFIPFPSINGNTTSVGSYANGVSPSTADGADGPNIDLIYPVAGELQDGDFANIFLYSRDDGKTWHYTDEYLTIDTEQKFEGGFSESTILENEAHELVWYCRYQTNQANHFAIAVSKDYGLTWDHLGENVESTVYAGATQPIMAEIDGDPFLVWGGNNAFGGHSYNRGPLSVAVSYDGLYTFRNIQNVFTETFLEDYAQTKYKVFITNPSVVKSKDDLIITYYWDTPYKVFTRITDYENWFYRTKGIYDSFESQNTKYEGWIPYMGGTALSTKEGSVGTYSLEVLPYGVVSRSVPYLQNGTVSMNVYSDGTSTYSIELQSAYSPVMGKAAPVSLTVEGTVLKVNGVDTGLSLNADDWNTITIDLGLAKKIPTVSVSVGNEEFTFNEADALSFQERVKEVGDYVCYIAVNTGDESVCLDEVLVQSNLDAINYNGEILDIDLAIITQPASQEKGIGEKATLRVAAQGYGLMYQWYIKDGNDWQAIVGATSATYTTDDLTDGDDGSQYKCIVMDRNENEVESKVATLAVEYISVSIHWGSMEFICNEENVWTPLVAGANEITVTNKSQTNMYASVTYQPVTGYDAISGSFDDDENPETASKELAGDDTVTWQLDLSSDGESNLEEGVPTAIGTVVISIQMADNH